MEESSSGYKRYKLLSNEIKITPNHTFEFLETLNLNRFPLIDQWAFLICCKVEFSVQVRK